MFPRKAVALRLSLSPNRIYFPPYFGTVIIVTGSPVQPKLFKSHFRNYVALSDSYKKFYRSCMYVQTYIGLVIIVTDSSVRLELLKIHFC
jgi:hypothetical protein